MTQHMSRRTILSAVPAAGAVFSVPVIAQGTEPDPVVPLYHEWVSARREWRELSYLPGNEDWDDPRSEAAMDRQLAIEKRMVALTPTSLEGIGALAALAWIDGVSPTECVWEDLDRDRQAILAIWRACTGQDGVPEV